MIAQSNRNAPRRGKDAGGKSEPAKLARSATRAALIKRMWLAADAQVSEIENRLLQDSPEPLERERDARVLAVLAKTLRELSALDDTRQPKARAPADDDAIPRNVDELRRSLARKLEALVAGDTTGLPRKP